MKIRHARTEDALSCIAIYTPYVRESAVTFELQVPSEEEMAQRLQHATASFVAEEGDRLLGYIYAHPFIERGASSHTAEVSLYLQEEATGKGVGRALLAQLEEALKERGISLLYARVVVPQEKEDERISLRSFHFHRAQGFQEIGRAHGCGKKFGTFYDMVWMEKVLITSPLG